jgi:hypothetical protein
VPACEAADDAPVPVGVPCAWCNEPIVAGDAGLLIWHVSGTSSGYIAPGTTRAHLQEKVGVREG